MCSGNNPNCMCPEFEGGRAWIETTREQAPVIALALNASNLRIIEGVDVAFHDTYAHVMLDLEGVASSDADEAREVLWDQLKEIKRFVAESFGESAILDSDVDDDWGDTHPPAITADGRDVS